MPKVAIVSLGCPKNLVDSEKLLSCLREEGYFFTPEAGEAEVVLVNTCGFIEDAKKESVEEILKLRHIGKRGGRLLVFGCLAKRYGDELAKEIPEIDAWWGVGEEERIVEYCRTLKTERSQTGADEDAESAGGEFRSGIFPSSSYAYLKIAEGCSRGCSYCVIPAIRGPYRSAAPQEILKKAEEHIRAGVKELVLVAQDLGSYGREFERYGLPSLLTDIASLKGDFRIRLLYLNPSSVSDGLLEVIAGQDRMCKYVDMPLQHSEERILKLMGRGGTRRSLTDVIKRVRDSVPGVTLRTTFIVGFPGETEDDFAGLRDFVEEMEFERLGVFVYSREEGTRAAGMKGQVPQKIRERRRDEIMKLQSAISLEKNMGLVGKRFRALVDEVDGGIAVARLSSQAPEIDGVVMIEKKCGAGGTEPWAKEKKGRKGSLRFTAHSSRALRAGEFVDVVVTEAYDYDLTGEVV